MTGSWYEVHLAPGTADPARLTRLPITPVTASSTGVNGLYSFIDSFGSVLSGSGTELAVPVDAAPREFAVKVFSVATGQLLHDWATTDASAVEEPSLTWIDGDRDLALVSSDQLVASKSPGHVTTNVTVREWPVAGPASGDLLADAKVAWDVQTVGNPLTTVQSCVEPVVGGPVLISADGKTFSCSTGDGGTGSDHLSFHTYPLTASTTATAQGRIDYQVTFQKAGAYIAYFPDVLWTSPSGGTLVGALIPYTPSPAAVAYGLRIGVISHGKFTPLRLPPNLVPAGQQLQPDQIAF